MKKDKHSNNMVLDQWELKLDDTLKTLKKCQVSKELKSCTTCSLFFSCKIRKDYIIAVYESMNKGSSGGFEF